MGRNKEQDSILNYSGPLEELEFLEFRLVEKGTRSRAYVEYKCVECKDTVIGIWSSVKRRKTGLCIKCSSKSNAILANVSSVVKQHTTTLNEINKYAGVFEDIKFSRYSESKAYVFATCPICKVRTERTFKSAKIITTGCQICNISKANREFSESIHYVYYVFFKKLNLYKIGVTSASIKERFYGYPDYDICWYYECGNSKGAYNEEFILLLKARHLAYTGVKVLSKSGNTELITVNMYPTIVDAKQTIKDYYDTK